LACQFSAVVGATESHHADIPVLVIGEAALEEEADFLGEVDSEVVAVAADGPAEVGRLAVAVQAEAGK
jgi:hypothetical protein